MGICHALEFKAVVYTINMIRTLNVLSSNISSIFITNLIEPFLYTCIICAKQVHVYIPPSDHIGYLLDETFSQLQIWNPVKKFYNLMFYNETFMLPTASSGILHFKEQF